MVCFLTKGGDYGHNHGINKVVNVGFREVIIKFRRVTFYLEIFQNSLVYSLLGALDNSGFKTLDLFFVFKLASASIVATDIPLSSKLSIKNPSLRSVSFIVALEYATFLYLGPRFFS